MVLHLNDGSTRKAEVIEALGSPGNPLSFDGVLEKARAVTALVDPAIDAAAIGEAVRRLPDIADIDELTRFLVAPHYDAPRDTEAAMAG